jgi:hypothetical protein
VHRLCASRLPKGEQVESFIGLNVAKAKHAVAIADAGRAGEVRYFGEIDTHPASGRRMVGKPEKPGKRLISVTKLGRRDMGYIGN